MNSENRDAVEVKEKQAKEVKVIPLSKEIEKEKQEEQEERKEMMVSISLDSINSYIGLLSVMLEGDDRLKGLTSQLIKIIQTSNPDLAEKKAG